VARARDPGVTPVSAYDVQAVTLGEGAELFCCAFAATSQCRFWFCRTAADHEGGNDWNKQFH
jgi:hypothetical protein